MNSNESQSGSIKVCVIPDTNVWFKERLLLGSMGMAFLRSIKQHGARIGLPEVIALELEQIVKEEGVKLAKSYSDASRAIGHFTGLNFWGVMGAPTPKSFENGLEERLNQLAPLLERIPFSHFHSQSALNRTILHTAPSLPKTDEFRDCAIWEAALELSTSYKVHLITNDRGFYQDGEIKKGPASCLVSEGQEKNGVCIHESLEAYLTTFPAPAISIPFAEIETMIERQLRSDASTGQLMTARTLGRAGTSELHPFLTEDPHLFAVKFKQEYEIQGDYVHNESTYTNASVDISGYCTYDAGSNSISDIRNVQNQFYIGGESRRLVSTEMRFNPTSTINRWPSMG